MALRHGHKPELYTGRLRSKDEALPSLLECILRIRGIQIEQTDIILSQNGAAHVNMGVDSFSSHRVIALVRI